MEQNKGQTNKSIFGYVVNNINAQKTDHVAPPLLDRYALADKNLDAEADLKGMTRVLSRCNVDKYTPNTNANKQ